MGNDHLLLQGQRPLLSAVGRLPGTRRQSTGSSPFPSPSRPQPRGEHSGPRAAWDQRRPDPGDAGEYPALTQQRRPIFPGAGARQRLTQEPLFSGAPSAACVMRHFSRTLPVVVGVGRRLGTWPPDGTRRQHAAHVPRLLHHRLRPCCRGASAAPRVFGEGQAIVM